MRRMVRTLLFLLLIVSLTAQQDPRAVNVMKAVQKKLQSINDMEAQFSYQIRMRGKKDFKPITKNGSFRMKKGNKYRIDLPEQSIYCDGKTVWTFLKEDEEVNISNYDPEESMSIQKIFAIFDQKMKVRYDGEHYVNGQKTRLLSFFPYSSKEDYFKILVWVNSNNIPVKMEIWNRNGSVITYTLKSIKTNIGLKDDIFVFDKSKYPDIEINDLR